MSFAWGGFAWRGDVGLDGDEGVVGVDGADGLAALTLAFVASLPHNALGKVLRKELRAQFGQADLGSAASLVHRG